jgi:prokaryotic ubiquitin-like protein Pup
MQTQVRKSHQSAKVQAVQEAQTTDASALKKELDDLLDEIDEVLEENAEEIVKNFVQHGGE